MAKRELSSTLKNLKFMQRSVTAQNRAKGHNEEVPSAPPMVVEKRIEEAVGFRGTVPLPRKCIVIMEGNPHPGAAKGRMSFQNFNPSVDKLNEEATLHSQDQGSSARDCSVTEMPSGTIHPEAGFPDDNDLKRKQEETEPEMDPPPTKLLKGINSEERGSASASRYSEKRKGSHKSRKHKQLDWNVLRPPKAAS